MNANLDVLELVFAQLDGAHLVAAAQVSRAFLAAAIPALYARIEYTPRHAKRAHAELSPFATVAAHPHLAVHVRRIALHAAPVFQAAGNIPHPDFLRDLQRALGTATNLRALVATVKILPVLLPHLPDKPRLHHLRVCAPLATRQTGLLTRCSGLHSLALDFPSWQVVDALPAWTAGMHKTLAHLTLFMSQDTDAAIFDVTLAQLPRLRGLHVIGCPRITHTSVLKALAHVPDLRELSLSVFPSQDNLLPPLNFPVPSLTHLSIDVRASYPGLKFLLARIISRLGPRDALAICGGWIGEIKASSEHDTTDGSAPGGPPPAADGQDPPLLSPPTPHQGNAPAPPPNPGLPPGVFGFTFPFPLGNHNGNHDNNDDPPGDGPPDPPDPEIINPDANGPSLIESLPSTLSTLHLPQISSAGLSEVLVRCDSIQLLGFVMGNLTSAPSAKSRKSWGFAVNGIRPQASILVHALSHATALRELIIDTGPIDSVGDGSGLNGPSSGGCVLFTPPAIRLLMQECPRLRRVTAEGRVWESRTPVPSSDFDIELSLTKVRYGAGAGYNHAHGPSGFGTHSGGYNQMQLSNDHWFWLTGSESAGKVYSDWF